jgi:hypothetical protein
LLAGRFEEIGGRAGREEGNGIDIDFHLLLEVGEISCKVGEEFVEAAVDAELFAHGD